MHRARFSGALLGAMWLLLVADLLLPARAWQVAGVACLVVFTAITFGRTSMHVRVLSLVIIGLAAAVAIAHRDWSAIIAGLEPAMVFGAFFVAVLLLRATLDRSPLVAPVRQALAQWSDNARNTWTLVISSVLGSTLQIGAYAIARPLLPANLSEEARARIAESAVKGLALSVTWSPFFVASAVATQLVPGVQVWQIIALGSVFFIVGCLLAFFVFGRDLDTRALMRIAPSFGPMLAAVGVLVAVVVLVSLLTPLTGLKAVALVVPALALLWLVIVDRASIGDVASRFGASLGRVGDEMIMMTSASLFAAVVGGSALGAGIGMHVAGLAAWPSIVIAAEVLMIAALGACGLHPMATAAVFAAIPGLHVGVVDVVQSYVIVLAWTLNALLSVWTFPVVMSASLFDAHVRRVAFGRNLPFALGMGGIGIAMLAGINQLLRSA